MALRLGVVLTVILGSVAIATATATAQQPVPALSLSDSTPDPGQTVTLTVECGVAGLADVAGIFGPLPGAGTVTPQSYNDAPASNAWPNETPTGRSGPVTFSAPGLYLLSVECFTAATSMSNDLVVTVLDPSATTTTSTTTTTTTTSPPTEPTSAPPPTFPTSAAVAPTSAAATDPASLPPTGSDLVTPWVIAMIAATVGAALVVLTRRFSLKG